MALFKLCSLHWHIFRVEHQYVRIEEKEDNFALEIQGASGMQCAESLVLIILDQS